MAIVLYSTGCPRCKVLKQKLDDKKIDYSINDSIQEMLDLGITTVPVLSVDGTLMSFGKAVKWVNQASLTNEG